MSIEKQKASDWVESVSCEAWHLGFAIVDGTLIPLHCKPGHHGEQLYDCKSNYSLSLTVHSSCCQHSPCTNVNIQLVTMPDLSIINYVLGLPGSVHNSTAFRESRAFKESETLFHKGEWLWANLAYGLASWCVTPYKRHLSLIPENCQFNYHLSWVFSLSSVLSTSSNILL
jgi:DDE superfamily endonuclease